MKRRTLLQSWALVLGASLGLGALPARAQQGDVFTPAAITVAVAPCPICHTDPQVSIAKPQALDWVDRDFMPSNWDPNSIVTCPHCSYSRVWSDFANPVAAEVSEAILRGTTLKIPPHSEAKLPGWARCDLDAQTETLVTGHPVKVGVRYLHASWCVRKEPPLFGAGATGAYSDVRPRLRDFARSKSADGARSILTMLYRHGEADTLLASLPVLLPNANAGDIAPQLQDGLQIDRHFMQLALAQFRTAEGQPQTDMRYSSVHYLAGELERRLGNYAAARTDYEAAREDADLQPTVAQWIDQQISLLPTH